MDLTELISELKTLTTTDSIIIIALCAFGGSTSSRPHM